MQIYWFSLYLLQHHPPWSPAVTCHDSRVSALLGGRSNVKVMFCLVLVFIVFCCSLPVWPAFPMSLIDWPHSPAIRSFCLPCVFKLCILFCSVSYLNVVTCMLFSFVVFFSIKYYLTDLQDWSFCISQQAGYKINFCIKYLEKFIYIYILTLDRKILKLCCNWFVVT